MSRRSFRTALALLMGVLVSAPAMAGLIDVASNNAAGRLVATQQLNGSWTGDPSFADYQGPVVAGLMKAYNESGNAAYKTAAQNGANFIMGSSSPNYLGDEMFALMSVSAAQANPNANAYRTAALNYYDVTIAGGVGGTNSYITYLVGQYTGSFNEQSQAVIYLAYHTMAADMANALDKSIWRTKLIDTLGQVDDADYYPTGALGSAVWALAKTGNGLHAGTTITGSSTVLNGMNLSQLPGLLASQMVAAGPSADNFYYDFGHTGNGYTEDAAFALLGLRAAYEADPGLGYGNMILNGQLALIDAVDGAGSTYVDVAQTPPAYNIYAGRLLQSVPEPTSAALLLCGLTGLMARRRHGQRRRSA